MTHKRGDCHGMLTLACDSGLLHWPYLEVQGSHSQAILVAIYHFSARELELARSYLGYKCSSTA